MKTLLLVNGVFLWIIKLMVILFSLVSVFYNFSIMYVYYLYNKKVTKIISIHIFNNRTFNIYVQY